MAMRKTYLERRGGRSEPVTVRAHWITVRPTDLPPWLCLHWLKPPRGVPRNVLIERQDGSRVVRPFRGLRKPKGTANG